MENFISSFAERSTSQKIIFIILGTVGFLVFLGLLYVLSTPSIKPTPVTYENSQFPTKVPARTGSSGSQNLPWKTYSDKTYSISYPYNFTAKAGLINKGAGGTALLIQAPKTETVPAYTIEIQVTDSAVTPFSRIFGIFSSFGYKQSDVSIGNIKAYRFTGQVGQGENALQDSAVIVEVGQKVYKIQLNYANAVQDSDIEETFLKIISSFKFT